MEPIKLDLLKLNIFVVDPERVHRLPIDPQRCARDVVIDDYVEIEKSFNYGLWLLYLFVKTFAFIGIFLSVIGMLIGDYSFSMFLLTTSLILLWQVNYLNIFGGCHHFFKQAKKLTYSKGMLIFDEDSQKMYINSTKFGRISINKELSGGKKLMSNNSVWDKALTYNKTRSVYQLYDFIAVTKRDGSSVVVRLEPC